MISAKLLKFTLFLILIYPVFLAKAQSEEDKPEIDIDEFILELFPQQDEDINYEDVYETLFQLYRNPINLNVATREDLASFFVLSELQINSLIEHREKFGSFLSIYELQTVEHFDTKTIQNTLPFVTVSPKNQKELPLYKRIFSYKSQQYLLLRYDRILEKRRGFTDQATPSQSYLGSPNRIYTRYRVSQTNDFSFGFTLEKDAGEQLTWDSDTRRYGMDFISFHAYLKNKGKLKALALGDYQIQFGQGLLLSAGLAFGKGAETVNTVRRPNLGIRPYTSTLETGFFRGVAATYNFGQIDITAFYSRVRRDGTFSEVSNDTLEVQEQFIETLRNTGFHRTANEVSGKGLFTEQTYGTNILFYDKKKNLQIGAIFLNTSYNLPFQRGSRGSKDSIRNRFEFNGQRNFNLGLHFNYRWQDFTFFGEGARSKSGGLGGVVGWVASLSPRVQMAMLYRNYARNFHTFFGSALSESTRNINERGMYWGIKILPIRKVRFSAYYDKFSFPWLRFRVDAPSEGYEYLAKASYQLSRRSEVYFQYREEERDRNVSSEDTQGAFRQIAKAKRQNYIINLSYKARKVITLKSRVQFSTFDFNSRFTSGLALIQDIGLDFGKLRLDGRIALFDTEDFENRQYVYEKDVLWAFSIPAYSGVGVRSYILLRYKLSRMFSFWLRYARFDYSDRDVIGSGGEQIQGNTRSEIKAQVRLKF